MSKNTLDDLVQSKGWLRNWIVPAISYALIGLYSITSPLEVYAAEKAKAIKAPTSKIVSVKDVPGGTLITSSRPRTAADNLVKSHDNFYEPAAEPALSSDPYRPLNNMVNKVTEEASRRPVETSNHHSDRRYVNIPGGEPIDTPKSNLTAEEKYKLAEIKARMARENLEAEERERLGYNKAEPKNSKQAAQINAKPAEYKKPETPHAKADYNSQARIEKEAKAENYRKTTESKKPASQKNSGLETIVQVNTLQTKEELSKGFLHKAYDSILGSDINLQKIASQVNKEYKAGKRPKKAEDKNWLSVKQMLKYQPEKFCEWKIRNELFEFTTEYAKLTLKSMAQRMAPYVPTIKLELAKHGLPTNLFTHPAQESGFQVWSNSGKDDVGFFQFIQETGRRHGLKIMDGYDERYNVYLSLEAYCEHMTKLSKNYNKNIGLMLTAYCGGLTVGKYIAKRERSGLEKTFKDFLIYSADLKPGPRNNIRLTYAAKFSVLAELMKEQHPEVYNQPPGNPIKIVKKDYSQESFNVGNKVHTVEDVVTNIIEKYDMTLSDLKESGYEDAKERYDRNLAKLRDAVKRSNNGSDKVKSGTVLKFNLPTGLMIRRLAQEHDVDYDLFSGMNTHILDEKQYYTDLQKVGQYRIVLPVSQ